MNKEQILGVIRHILTFVGGILVLRGTLDEALAEQIAGGVFTIISTIWSIFAKNAEGQKPKTD